MGRRDFRIGACCAQAESCPISQKGQPSFSGGGIGRIAAAVVALHIPPRCYLWAARAW